ncbi:unnamed protein product [Protopolystoma xenopodis]|uniref:Bicarbonate transporter-like transmembrane domain-containing protein n=1 Tax=Protopolystoma xenopodis TaxID=117903 RepID=A0A3S4ZLR6_9PLAT|nr:unnamed protein product [Protopolystoma xenopodis]
MCPFGVIIPAACLALIPFELTDPALVSTQDLPHGPIGPFPIFLLDPLLLVPAPGYFYSSCYLSDPLWHVQSRLIFRSPRL